MGEPSSPGTNPVDMKDCIEELLKFTLDSHINGTLEFGLGLSKEFCSLLLEDCHCHTDCLDKNLQYPLYKFLASSLYESIASGAFSGRKNEMASFKENDLLLGEQKEDDESKQKQKWLDLILDRGNEIVNILKSINFELHVQEPFFTQLKDGHKTVEGRCATGDYNRIESGSYILFNKCLVHEVQEVRHYASFHEMLESEGLAKVLPGVKTTDRGVQVYRNFYTEEKERSNGVLAICVAKSPSQPYFLLAEILSGLRCGGAEYLLGQNTQQGLLKAKSVPFSSSSSPV